MTQQELETYLWGAAKVLRGTIDAGDYKQYVFPLLFFKPICDVYDEEFERALKESNGDIEFAAFVEHHHFIVPQEAHWSRPQFNLEEGFKVILYRPWSQTAPDTIHDRSHFALANLTHRLVWKIQGEMSRDELMVTLELKNRDNFQKSFIKPAMEEGWIENTLPEKKTSKNQKYRLTKKGLSLQKKLKNEPK